MRLMVIRNEPKRIISISGGLGLLQMVLEPFTRQYEALVGVGLDPLHRVDMF